MGQARLVPNSRHPANRMSTEIAAAIPNPSGAIPRHQLSAMQRTPMRSAAPLGPPEAQTGQAGLDRFSVK